ncbi:unnamed protein product [Parnassius apollo]|uniref:(apollo) hypothetical protein n=1 Tax=Parnassius apollo TaxID=110799 RepID=A0A8S3WXA9_PARAO|nr:unnamed protein product [Parnassius apollo]
MQIVDKYRVVSESGSLCERGARQSAATSGGRGALASEGRARGPRAPGATRASPRDTGRANGHRDPPPLRNYPRPAPRSARHQRRSHPDLHTCESSHVTSPTHVRRARSRLRLCEHSAAPLSRAAGRHGIANNLCLWCISEFIKVCDWCLLVV